MPEVLFEMRYQGNVVRVTAIDPATGIEVITVGDASSSPAMLKRVAARKLYYVLERRAEKAAAAESAAKRDKIVKSRG